MTQMTFDVDLAVAAAAAADVLRMMTRPSFVSPSPSVNCLSNCSWRSSRLETCERGSRSFRG